MSVLLSRTQASPTLAHRRATPQEIGRMTPNRKIASTCFYCEVTYREAEAAWICEHWHEGIRP